MSEPAPSTLPRPRQVTLAAWMIIGGSALVVLTVFDRIAGLNSLETRESIELFLAEPPGSGLGLSVPDAVGVLRVLSMVAGACAAATAILGVHVLRRHRGARIAVSVLAPPLFVSGFVIGGFLSSVVAASAVMLWMEPARDWFAGRPAKERPAARRPGSQESRDAGAAREDRPDPFRVFPSVPPVSSGPRPHQGFGTAAATAQQARPQVSAYAPPGGAPARPARPGAVMAAAVVTWVVSGLVSLLMALSATMMLASPELMMDEALRANPALADSGLTVEAFQLGVVVTAAVAIAWSVAAAVFAAVLLLRGRDWARISLLISAAIAAALCLPLTLLGGVPMLVPLAGSVATLALLLRREVRAWVARA